MNILLFVIAVIANIVPRITADATDTEHIKTVGTLPICTQACITTIFKACACHLADFNCLCANTDFIPLLKDCLEASCPFARTQNDLDTLSAFCAHSTQSTKPSTSQSTDPPSSTSHPLLTTSSSSSPPQPTLTSSPQSTITPSTQSALFPPSPTFVEPTPLQSTPTHSTRPLFTGYSNFTRLDNSTQNTYHPIPYAPNAASKDLMSLGGTLVLCAWQLFFL